MPSTHIHHAHSHIDGHGVYTEHQLSYEAIVLELLIPESHPGGINVYALLEGILQCVIYPNISVASLYQRLLQVTDE